MSHFINKPTFSNGQNFLQPLITSGLSVASDGILELI